MNAEKMFKVGLEGGEPWIYYINRAEGLIQDIEKQYKHKKHINR